MNRLDDRGVAVRPAATWIRSQVVNSPVVVTTIAKLTYHAGEGFKFRFFSDSPQYSTHQAPAVPFALSLGYRALGMGTPAAHFAIQLLTIAFSTAGIFSVYWVGALMWDRRVSHWSAGLFAVYSPLVYAVTRIQAVNWAVPSLLM